MNALEKPKKYEILCDLSEVVEAINKEPSFLGGDETFWYVMEKLSRAMALIESLPSSLIEKELASKRCLTAFNEYMTDWSDGISPMGGWSKDLLARMPAADIRVASPDSN